MARTCRALPRTLALTLEAASISAIAGKYGLRRLAEQHTYDLIAGIKLHSKSSSRVLLFGRFAGITKASSASSMGEEEGVDGAVLSLDALNFYLYVLHVTQLRVHRHRRRCTLVESIPAGLPLCRFIFLKNTATAPLPPLLLPSTPHPTPPQRHAHARPMQRT